MLTTRQALVVSGQNGDTLHLNALLTEFPARPLSLKSVITAYEKQRLVVFVSLVSTKVFRSPGVLSMDEVIQASIGAQGQMDGREVLALSSKLREQGLSLRVLDRDLRKAAIIGTAPSLVNAPTTVVNDGNLLKIQDRFAGAEAAGGIAAGVGGVIIAIAFIPEPFSPVLLIIGGVLLGGGAGFGIGAGVMDILHDTPPPPKSNSPETSTTPNDAGPDGPDGQTIELPNAVAVGSPPDGFSTDGVLQQLGDIAIDFSVDFVLSDLPVGFDPVNGDGLPGYGDGGDGGGAGDDGDIIPVG
jgi:hypothetical protein